jgi:hypothetical protein
VFTAPLNNVEAKLSEQKTDDYESDGLEADLPRSNHESELEPNHSVNEQAQPTHTGNPPEEIDIELAEIRATLSRWWASMKDPTSANRTIAIGTITIALFTAGTWWVILSGSRDTRDAAAATQTVAQATVAEVIAFVHVVPNIQAFRLPNNQIKVVVGFKNDGKTIAQNVNVAPNAYFRERAPTDSEYGDNYKLLTYGQFVAVNAAVYDTESATLETHFSRLYYWGKLEYDDWRGQPVRPPQKFCGYILTSKVVTATPGDQDIPPKVGTEGYNDCERP